MGEYGTTIEEYYEIQDRFIEKYGYPCDVENWDELTKDIGCICCECGATHRRLEPFRTRAKDGKAICTGCIQNHMKKGDLGAYPRETSMGIISDLFLLFEDWDDFFEYIGKKDDIALRGYEYALTIYDDGKKYITETGNTNNIDVNRYYLIATEKMLEEFPGELRWL